MGPGGYKAWCECKLSGQDEAVVIPPLLEMPCAVTRKAAYCTDCPAKTTFSIDLGSAWTINRRLKYT